MNNRTIIIAGSVIAVGLIIALRRRRRHAHDVARSTAGHATPAGGQGRPKTAPAYFTA
ncbi:MAG: hypothetical protein LKI24_11285 [Acidipropionibacterium sp.]|jgi:hypothetical protein|nr:hypothetical protein [Acidipropionibacterium sp.]